MLQFCSCGTTYGRSLGEDEVVFCGAIIKKEKEGVTPGESMPAHAKCRLFKRTSNLQRALDSKFSERFYIVGPKWKKKQRLSPERVTQIMFARVWSTQRLAMLIFIVKRTTSRVFSPLSSPFFRSFFFFISLIYPFAECVCGDLVVCFFFLSLFLSKTRN